MLLRGPARGSAAVCCGSVLRNGLVRLRCSILASKLRGWVLLLAAGKD
jgi:hypothetical protein